MWLRFIGLNLSNISFRQPNGVIGPNVLKPVERMETLRPAFESSCIRGRYSNISTMHTKSNILQCAIDPLVCLSLSLYRKAKRNQCTQTTKLNEKQPCRHLEDCPPRSYEPTIFNPFPGNGDDNLSGYSSAWSRRGFESSMKPSYERKYLYT